MHVPYLILILVLLASGWIKERLWHFGADVLGPCVVDSGQILKRLSMRRLGKHDRVIVRNHSVAIDLVFLLLLEALETKHGDPEYKCDDQVEKNDDDTNQLLANLHIFATEVDMGGCASGQEQVLPVPSLSCGERASVNWKVTIFELELTSFASLALLFEFLKVDGPRCFFKAAQVAIRRVVVDN